MATRIQRTGRLIIMAVAAGLAQVLAGGAMYLAGIYFERWSLGVSALVLLAGIWTGGRRYIDDYPEGSPGLWRIARAGLVISLTTGVLYAIYNIVSVHYLYPHFLDDLAGFRLARLSQTQLPVPSFGAVRAGLSAERLAVSNLLLLTTMGAVLSLPCAALLSRRAGAAGGA